MHPGLPDPGDSLRIDPSLFRARRRQAGVGAVLAIAVLTGFAAPEHSTLELGAQTVAVSTGVALLVMLLVTAARSTIIWLKTADIVVVKMPQRGGRR